MAAKLKKRALAEYGSKVTSEIMIVHLAFYVLGVNPPLP